MSQIEQLKEEQLLENEVESSLTVEPLSPEEERELTEDKRREEADSRDRDLAEGWEPN